MTPVVALPAFWLLPLSIALPVYALALAIAFWVYALAIRTGRRPAMTGAEGMIGESGRVVRVERRTATLQIHGELWFAEAAGEPLAAGETALVVGIKGLRLKAKRRERWSISPARADEPGMVRANPSVRRSSAAAPAVAMRRRGARCFPIARFLHR
jgi:membrane-bound ClpP family serine protease